MPGDTAYNRWMTLLNSAAASVRQTNVSGRPPARPSKDSTSERLAIAEKLLLAPFGLTEAALSRALGEITAYGVDDADLYFQYTRSEGWSLEEGCIATWTRLPRLTAPPKSSCSARSKNSPRPKTRASCR